MPQTQLTGDLPYEAVRLDHELRHGSPVIGFKGDPRLYLLIGVLTAAKGGYKNGKWVREGTLMGRRYEVHRHNEDGTDKRIISRPLEKLHEILPALCVVDPRNPGHEDTMVTVEKHNAKVDADKEYAIGQAHGEMTEHLWKLVRDRREGKSSFGREPGTK